MTTKPIFAYIGDFCLDAKDQKLLARRVFCYRRIKDTIKDLDKYLSTGKIDREVDLNDKEFLKFYGLSSAGMGSEARAAKALKEILSKWPEVKKR